MDFITALAKEFELKETHVKNIVSLIDEGNTIPFIARYRKEMTGSCDDQVLRQLSDRLTYLRNLEKRKEEVRASIIEQEKMTDALETAIAQAQTITEVEDIYRPFRPKRKTRATVAKEKGLEGLAKLLLEQNLTMGSLEELAEPYINADKGVNTTTEAIDGAKDIIAEQVSDDADLRKTIREILRKDGLLVTTGTKEEDSVYSMYYDYSEPLLKLPSHRILAINRGEKEGFLKVTLQQTNERAVTAAVNSVVKEGSITTELVKEAAIDAFERLIFPSVERELRNELTEKANQQAIATFALNLKPLLLQPPIKGKVAMGFDPAYRTGCKISVVDETGKLLDYTVVYPTPPQNKKEEAKKELKRLVEKYHVDMISIGNGTASKESEIFIAEFIKELDRKVSYMVVSESGASVYSASKLGAQEFPDLDVSIRSSVSIARRLQDPLAELVKIDPKAIGVGQYQHDMPPAQLDNALSGVVEDCVNSVGVDLNTASAPLLTYISGLNASIAKNVVAYRDENGSFQSRVELKKVSRLGPKAYEQCAGFLRIPGGKQILDNTSVHPESYAAVKKLLALFHYSLQDVQEQNLSDLPQKIADYGIQKVADTCEIGIPTLHDIVKELQKPGRDLRDELPPPMLRSDIMDMNDLKRGMKLTGTVRNVTDFGAFVDIGVHQDGLVHISQLSTKFVKHPSDIVKVGDVVTVYVLDVDVAKKRIALTMIAERQEA